MKEFRFVLNDRFAGTYPEVEKALLELKNKHGLADCGPLIAKDLMRVFGELDERHVLELTGHIPAADDIDDLDFSLFTDVLTHVVKSGAVVAPPALLRVPDFSEKIALNGISPPVGALLQTGSFQSGAVEDYFNRNGGVSKRAIRDRLAALYAMHRQSLPAVAGAGAPKRGDAIFFALLDEVTPAPKTASVQTAAIVLLAYFFESCDIYEDPNVI